MHYTGLIPKYKVNRPLTQEERDFQLKQKEKLDAEPHYQLAVIRMNSTFLECVDKYYAWKGLSTVVMLVIIGMCSAFLIGASFTSVKHWIQPNLMDRQTNLLFLISAFILFSPLIAVAIWLLRKDSFSYTHYPMRLNRRNRMVYVFRFDGSALAVPWDEVFFTLGRCTGGVGSPSWDIRGHVLDKEGKMVRESFAFSYVGDPAYVRRHWEFLRRYMEDGPSTLVEQVEFCMPVDGGYESFRAGMERIFANDAGLAFVYWTMLPFNILTGLGRFIAMRSSKIPTWPAAIEQACPIDSNDPYVRDSRINPKNLQQNRAQLPCRK